MVPKITIYTLFVLSLFDGLLVSLGVPRYINDLFDPLIYLALLFSIMSRSGKGIQVPPLWQFFVLFLFFSVLSSFINELSLIKSIFSLRLIFRFYFFFLTIILLDPNDNQIKAFNLFILCLLILQFPVVGVKFLKYGISERTAGAYAIHDGSIATTLPISFIFYMASFYFLYQHRLRFIIFGIGYVVCSIVGAKRAILFLYPFQFLAIYYYLYSKSTNANLSKKIALFVGCILLISIISVSILYFNKSLNPSNETGGEIDLGYALEYAKRYNSGIDEYGNSFGRIATTNRILQILSDSGISQIFFGLGPGTVTPSLFDSRKEKLNFEKRVESFKIKYGWTAINRIALEYGLIGAFIYSAMLIALTVKCIKLYRIETDPYWKAFSAGSVGFSFSMLFFACAYHFTTFFGDTMPTLYFYSMAIVHIRFNRNHKLEKKFVTV